VYSAAHVFLLLFSSMSPSDLPEYNTRSPQSDILPLSYICDLSPACCTLSLSLPSLKIKAEAKKHSDVFGGGDGYDDRFDDYNASKSRSRTPSVLSFPLLHISRLRPLSPFPLLLFIFCGSLLAIEIASP
jgi:hypothetical protein